jgi:hypothetical protein
MAPTISRKSTARNRQDRLFLDLMLHGVDHGIRANHTFREIGIALDQGPGGIRDLPFRKPAHLGDLARELLQIGIEGLGGVIHSWVYLGHNGYPKRPVM